MEGDSYNFRAILTHRHPLEAHLLRAAGQEDAEAPLTEVYVLNGGAFLYRYVHATRPSLSRRQLPGGATLQLEMVA
jgi:hypothetical protein